MNSLAIQPFSLSSSYICLHCGRPGFSPWVGKIPWRMEKLPTPVFWPGDFHGLYSPWDPKESDTTEWLSLSHLYMTTGKTIALTRQTFVSKVMSLLFNTLSRFVIVFLPRSKCLLISWLQSLSTVIENQENKICHCSHCFPIYLPWSDGTRCHDLSFLNAEFSGYSRCFKN